MVEKVVDLDNYRNQKELQKVDSLGVIAEEIASLLTNPAQEIEIFDDEDYDKAQEFFTFTQTLEEELDNMCQSGTISNYDISIDNENRVTISVVPIKEAEFIAIDMRVGKNEDYDQ